MAKISLGGKFMLGKIYTWESVSRGGKNLRLIANFYFDGHFAA